MMTHTHSRSTESAGSLLSVMFVCLAAGRDVYFGALFQRVHPLAVALTAFTVCTLVFPPVALARDRAGLARLRCHWPTLVWINATSAIAWISFFHALRIAEPALVQVVFFGIGPLWHRSWRAVSESGRLCRDDGAAHVGYPHLRCGAAAASRIGTADAYCGSRRGLRTS